MADELLAKLAEDVKRINSEIERANTLISVMKDAGEDTTEAESSLRTLMMKRDKWQRTLSDRGYTF